MYVSRKIAEDALRLMAKAHAGQSRRDGSPYFLHPIRVARILLKEIGNTNPIAEAMALAHDVIEKTEVKTDELKAILGPEVTDGVLALSKSFKNTTHGSAKFAANKNYYTEILQNLSTDLKQVKIADRLDNLRSMSTCDQEFQNRQMGDTENMINALGDTPGVELLKKELQHVRSAKTTKQEVERSPRDCSQAAFS